MYQVKGYKSILQDGEYCFLCAERSLGLDAHHVFNKFNKSKSEKYGLMVYLCRKCHQKIHDTDTPLRRQLEAFAQSEWEKQYGSREDFIKEFNKNYAL